MGKWISPGDLQGAIDSRFPGCMKGRTMYVIPFSMGPIGGPISKNGVQLTDSAYVVVSMNIMTRMDKQVLIRLRSKTEEFRLKFIRKGIFCVGLNEGLKWHFRLNFKRNSFV